MCAQQLRAARSPRESPSPIKPLRSPTLSAADTPHTPISIATALAQVARVGDSVTAHVTAFYRGAGRKGAERVQFKDTVYMGRPVRLVVGKDSTLSSAALEAPIGFDAAALVGACAGEVRRVAVPRARLATGNHGGETKVLESLGVPAEAAADANSLEYDVELLSINGQGVSDEVETRGEPTHEKRHASALVHIACHADEICCMASAPHVDLHTAACSHVQERDAAPRARDACWWGATSTWHSSVSCATRAKGPAERAATRHQASPTTARSNLFCRCGTPRARCASSVPLRDTRARGAPKLTAVLLSACRQMPLRLSGFSRSAKRRSGGRRGWPLGSARHSAAIPHPCTTSANDSCARTSAWAYKSPSCSAP